MGIRIGAKRVRALQQKKYREEEGLYLVQGIKLVEELLLSQHQVEAIIATQAMAERLRDDRVEVLPPHEMERLGTFENGNEVIAVVRKPKVEALGGGDDNELILAFDGIGDPGNMGTLLRIADWFGVKRVLCSAESVEEFNPKCVQASMGSIFRIGVVRCDLPKALDDLRSRGARLYLASMEGANVLEAQLERPAVLILGSESHGPSPEVRALGAKTIAIPRIGQAESLNVAAAASALCMEFLRKS